MGQQLENRFTMWHHWQQISIPSLKMILVIQLGNLPRNPNRK